jgi:hypothetical protein
VGQRAALHLHDSAGDVGWPAGSDAHETPNKKAPVSGGFFD